MVTAQLDTLMRHLRGLAAGRQRTDRQLLDEFTSRGDERAFAGLVRRHGPMVLRICRRVLRHEQDAEDAFQATFLVLARNTASIRQREALASWLYGVAYRTAMKAKRGAARRRGHEARLRQRTPPPAASPTWDDVQAVLDEEVQRLPESFRAAFVLCVLDGKTVPAAAAELGAKEGTLSWRLARARQRLRQRLARRGIQLSAVLAALTLGHRAGKAAVPAALASSTVRFGLSVAAGEPAAGVIPAHVAALAAGVTRAMFVNKAKIAVLLTLALGLFALGAGVLACQAPAAPEPAAQLTAPAEPAAPPEKKGGAAEATDKDAVTLQGQVLDPDGKPAAGAKLYLLGGNGKNKAAGRVRATADQDGRFRLTADRDQAPLVAVADGYGPAWAGDFNKPDGLTLRLVKDDVPITGRVVDLQGKPIAGVTLKPHALKASPTGKLDAWLEAAKVGTEGMPLEHERLAGSLWQPALASLFPRITTDEEGRFRLKGVGRERVVALIVEGPTVETQEINVVTRAGVTPFQLPFWSNLPDYWGQLRYYGASLEYVSPPCRPVAGVVRDRATGEPIPGAVVQAERGVGNPSYLVKTITDADGRYRLTGLGKGHGESGARVVALAPDDQPYLGLVNEAGGGEGLTAVTLDFQLKRGIWVRGRVTDKATGRGVRSRMTYSVFADRLEKGEKDELYLDPFVAQVTDPSGKFRFVGYPGRGVLGARAAGPEEEHYRISVGATEIEGGANTGPGDLLQFVTFPRPATAFDGDAWKEINPAPGAKTVTCDFTLEPGRSLRVRVEGPDGKPLEGASVMGQGARDMWSAAQPAEFPLYGLEDGKGRTRLFRHPQKGLAGLREIKGDDNGTVVVRLRPAASARGRLLKDDGRPWPHVEVPMYCVLKQRPGWAFDHAPQKVRTDAEGRFRADGLIPDVKYYAMVMQGRYPRGVFADLALTSGQTKDLGDVTPKKARDTE
jgi:RNA polymerase sigma factor (sigma-70 family)